MGHNVEPASSDLNTVLHQELASWPVRSAGVAVLDAHGLLATAGEAGPFPWASVTKLLTALAVLHATEEGSITLDERAGPPNATVRHLLSHSSGLAAETDKIMADPGTRRIYSNLGIELVAEHLERRTGRRFELELQQRVLCPLGMTNTHLEGSPAHGASGPVTDLSRLAQELLRPRCFGRDLIAAATTPYLPELSGVLPGFGRQESNAWGLGFEVRGHKSPHWMSPKNAPSAFGHFGQSGAFLWVDREASLACVVAGDTAFGPWAAVAWPRLSTRVLETAIARPHDHDID